MLQLAHLKAFVAVAEEGHFGRAAERLHITQPPLSRQIQLLERELEVSLLERSNRVVALTPAGRTFLGDARRLLRLAEEAQLSVKRVAEGSGGTLTIGFIPASSYELIPRIVSLTAVALPAVNLVLREMVTADQIEALSARQIDMGILRLPVDHGRFETLCIDRDAMVLAVAEDHPLAQTSSVRLADLDAQPMVMYAPVESRYHHDLISALLGRAKVSPRFVQYARETHTMLGLVGAKLGLAIVPSSAARLRPLNVSIRRLDLATGAFSEMSLAWRRGHADPALATFCALAVKVLQPG